MTKLVLLILGYFWIGAAYKVVYAQTHDITRMERKLPVPYYRQQFLLDSLLHQTWIFGPEFDRFIGALPPLSTFVSANPMASLSDWCRAREDQLAALPEQYPYGLFAEEALDDASAFYGPGASVLSVFGTRERPRQALAFQTREGDWRFTSLPDMSRPRDLALRLADNYPDSPQAPGALLRVAQALEQEGRAAEGAEVYARLAREYPRSAQAGEAASALSRIMLARGKVREARLYKEQALRASELSARQRFPGRALPARNRVSILGFRVDLSGLELRLQRVVEARTELDVAQQEAERVRSLRGLEGEVRRNLGSTERKLDRSRNELWVADLYEKLRVGVPGPPPRPKEYDVTGVTLVGGQPIAGVEVGLVEPSAPQRRDQASVGDISALKYRGISDRHGEYRITGVPSGRYWVASIYPVRPAEVGPIVPPRAGFPRELTIEQKAVRLPDLRFDRGVDTRTFGELPPSEKSVRLEWGALPGAAAYRTQVRAAFGSLWAFQKRHEKDLEAYLRRPVLWTSKESGDTRVECPLLALAPDNPTVDGRFVQYEYEVSALDGSHQVIAQSSRPVSRFFLSPAARSAMLALKPPVRRRGPPTFRIQRRRRGRP